jgi:hypothetical protein
VLVTLPESHRRPIRALRPQERRTSRFAFLSKLIRAPVALAKGVLVPISIFIPRHGNWNVTFLGGGLFIYVVSIVSHGKSPSVDVFLTCRREFIKLVICTPDTHMIGVPPSSDSIWPFSGQHGQSIYLFCSQVDSLLRYFTVTERLVVAISLWKPAREGAGWMYRELRFDQTLAIGSLLVDGAGESDWYSLVTVLDSRSCKLTR